MNTLIMQKHVNILETFVKKASRVLLEFEVAQSKWEIEHGKYKAYKSADAYIRHVESRLKS